MEYSVSPLNAELDLAHRRLFPNYEASFAWKLEHGGLVSSARMGDQVVGLNAFIRVMLRVGSAIVPGYQSFDTIVHESARGRGVFSGLIQAFYDSNPNGALLYGFPNASSAAGFFGKLGWTRLGTPPFMVKPLRAGYLLRRLGLEASFPLSFCRPGGERFERFGPDADEVWRHFSGKIGCAVDRSSAYLNHRVSSSRYQRFGSFRSGRLTSYVVTRVTQKHGGTIGYVMEGMGADLSELLRGAAGHMREEGAEVALTWCAPWSPNFASYLRAGFVPLPEKLRPIALNFGARALRPVEAGLRARDWYISYLDSDTV